MKKKLLLFIVVFLITMIITYVAIPISHPLDSYCTMCNGYKDTAIWFLKNGRVFSYLFYNLFGLLNLSYDYLGMISIIIGNIILSYAIILLYKELKTDNKYLKYIMILLLILLFYNPLYIDILLLDEAFIIDLGLLFMILASIKFNKEKYLLSLLYLILGIMCYQGIVSYFIVLVFILNDKKLLIQDYIKKISLIIILYGLSFLSNLLIIKLVGFILKDITSKVGTFNIISNIKIIISELLPESLLHLFGFINIKYYYLISFMLLIVCFIYIIKNKDKTNNIVLLFILLVSAIITPFIPNIFMNTDVNYTAARMTLTLGIIPTILLLFLIINFKINKNVIYVLGMISVIILGLSSYHIHQNMKIDLKRFDTDIEYINILKENISKYELENDIKVDKIYYTYDTDSAYYYNFGYANGANIRLLKVDWALECAIKAYIDKDISIIKMDNNKSELLFKDKEYDDFNLEQLVFEDNKLYLLIY